MMSKKLSLSTLALAAAMTLTAPASASTFIDFETDDDGAATLAGALVDNAYSDFGLTFSDAQFLQCGGGCPDPTFGIFVSSADFGGSFTVNFDSVVSNFMFSNVSFSDGTAEAFDLGGDSLGVINFSGFDFDNPNDTNFSFGASGISSISFSSADGGGFGVDNFSFTPSGVPEPGTWALMLLGFFGIGAMMRRRESRVSSMKVSYS